jgi:hypothetical protein
MNVRNTGCMRTKLGLIVIVLTAHTVVSGRSTEKANPFNPFTLQGTSVVMAIDSPSVEVQPRVMLSDWFVTDARLTQAPLRPTIALRGFKIRIPVRPALRSPWRVGIVRW